jgi:hypothetical protein
LSTVACTRSDYVANNGDCDDSRASANPVHRAVQRARRQLRHGGSVGRVDGDGDTYMTCEGDCDDTDASAYPGSLIFYRDVDGDGYGWPPRRSRTARAFRLRRAGTA